MGWNFLILDMTTLTAPTEIEAYRYAVKEARRLGLSEERICCYLRTEWMSDAEFARLCKSVDVHISNAS